MKRLNLNEMKKSGLTLLASIVFCAAGGQNIMTLEECRRLAVENNKNIQIAKENIEVASRLKKAAFTQFLPNFSATGTYIRNQKSMSLLSEDAHLPVGKIMPDGSFAPIDTNGIPFDPTVNPEKLNYALLPREAMEFDMKNVFAGTIGFTQPIYMGGKIRELNKLAKYGEDIAEIGFERAIEELLVEVDEAYWRVVSVEAKVALAKEYQGLIGKVNTDMEAMMAEGVATRADELKVRVKLNEADLSLTRAEDGLSLSRMALNQLCGLPIDGLYVIGGAGESDLVPETKVSPEEAFANRDEIKTLELMRDISLSNQRIARSRFMPNIVATGGYLISNPNVFNGFSNKFNGMFNVGVGLNIPIFHFGERVHTLKAANAQTRITAYRLEEVKEKIELQVHQSAFRMNESLKKREATQQNIGSAEENLRLAQEGFAEGVISSTDLLAAQAAWLSAKSDDIDAAIDVRLCRLYLEKALGKITIHK